MRAWRAGTIFASRSRRRRWRWGCSTRAVPVRPISTADYPTPARPSVVQRARQDRHLDRAGPPAAALAGEPPAHARGLAAWLACCVTGGAGFIGANFVLDWLARTRASRVVVLDALTYAGNLASLEPLAAHDRELTFVHGDIGDAGARRAAAAASTRSTPIVHFAAESHVDRSIHGPGAFIETNVVGTHGCSRRRGRSGWSEGGAAADVRFHHVSTDEVYGSLGPDDPPFHEDTPYAPNSPYSASKAASDHLVRAYHHTYGLPVTTTNCSNNYGPYQFPEKLIPLMIVNALEGKPLPVYGDGRNVRDWLYVEDHCRAIERVLRRGPARRDLQRRRPERVAEHRHRAPVVPPGRRGVRGGQGARRSLPHRARRGGTVHRCPW